MRHLRTSLGLCLLLTCVGACASTNPPLPDWVTQAAAEPFQAAQGGHPKAAVLLEDKLITVNLDETITERYRQVIRIMRPQGRDYAHPVAWYNKNHKLLSFHVWSIGPDGHQYAVPDKELFEGGAEDSGILYDDVRFKSAVVPGTDPGGVVAYEYTKQIPMYAGDEGWGFQNPIPTVKSVFEVDLPAGWHSSALWHNHASVAPTEVAPNRFRWELDNIPAIDLDSVPLAPADDALAGRMEVYFSANALPDEPQLWTRIGEWYTQLAAPQSEGPADIATESRTLTSANADFLDRIQKVASFMQRQIRYVGIEIGIGGYIPHSAEDVYRNHYGDCKDKVTLMIALLDAVGVRATWVMVDTDRGVVDPNVPSLRGDHMIAAIEIPPGYENPALKAVVTAKTGKRYLIFDPTNQYVPIGLLPTYLQGGYGLLMAGANSQVIGLPILRPDADVTSRTADFTLTADGTLTGNVIVKRLGASSDSLRRSFAMSNQDDILKRLENSLRSDFSSFNVGTEDVQNVQALNQQLIFHYQITASDYAKHAGTMLLVRPRINSSDAVDLTAPTRKYPIEFDGTGDWRDSYNVKIPAGYAVDELPDPVNVDTDFASYHSAVKANGDLLHYTRDYVVKKVHLNPDEYSQLRDLENKIYMDENQDAILKKLN